MKITYLLSHVPIPRFYKKMKKAKEEFDVSVIYRNRKSERFHTFFDDKEINKYEIIDGSFKSDNFSIGIYCLFLKKALNQLSKLNPSIIHCGNLDMLLIAYIYKKIFNKNVKIVYEIGDLNKRTYNESKNPLKILLKLTLRGIENITCKNVDLLIISSQYFWDFYYYKYIPKEKTFYFPNAPERNIFKRIEEKKDKSKITIGFIGSVRYAEQLKMLVDVINEINDQKSKNVFELLIAGTGPESNLISEYVKNMDFVEMYGPYNYDKEIASIYSKIDIVYSVYDSSIANVRVAIPNRLYEAIVSEKPIIVAKGTKLEQFVVKNGIGYAVDSKNADDLRKLLTNIIEKKVRFEDIKEKCRKIKNNYYIDYYQRELIERYMKLNNM